MLVAADAGQRETKGLRPLDPAFFCLRRHLRRALSFCPSRSTRWPRTPICIRGRCAVQIRHAAAWVSRKSSTRPSRLPKKSKKKRLSNGRLERCLAWRCLQPRHLQLWCSQSTPCSALRRAFGLLPLGKCKKLNCYLRARGSLQRNGSRWRGPRRRLRHHRHHRRHHRDVQIRAEQATARWFPTIVTALSPLEFQAPPAHSMSAQSADDTAPRRPRRRSRLTGCAGAPRSSWRWGRRSAS